MEKLNVHQFQICCARTKYLSYYNRLCWEAIFLPIRLTFEKVKCQKLGEIWFK